MTEESLTTGLLAGLVLIVFGLVPGLLHQLAAGVAAGIRNFRNSMSPGLPVAPARPVVLTPAGRPLWLALVGALLIAFTLAAYNLT